MTREQYDYPAHRIPQQAQHTEVEWLRAEIERLRRLVDAREADLGRMHGETSAEIERLRAAHRHIQGIAEQAEVYHTRMGASQTFAAIADAAKTALEPKP